MTDQSPKFSKLLGLTRPEMLAALVSGLWLLILLGAYIEPQTRRNSALDSLGLGVSLGLSAVIAVGLGLFMMALNDALDARHDRAFEPKRPIPSGQVTQRSAFSLAMIGLLTALGATVPFGSLSMFVALISAGGIVFYNVAGRFVPAVGVITIGLIIGITALIPNPNLAFAWPILLMITHTIASATLRHWLAVKRPALTPINAWFIIGGWVFWSLVVLMLIRVRGETITHHGVGLIWIGPAVAALIFSLILWLILGPSTLHPRAKRGTARRFTRLATAWLIVFNSGWLFSAGLWWQGLLLAGLVLICLMKPGEHAR